MGLNELELIDLIRRRAGDDPGEGLLAGIGDDCAVIAPREGYEQLLTTDTLVEGVHFRRAWAAAPRVGWKAAAVNLSDIAAMGGQPRFMLLSLALPDDVDRTWAEGFIGGFLDCCRPHGVRLVGGNVTASPTLAITVTALGEVTPGERVGRNGARPGERLWVTGTPGDAPLGLALLAHGQPADGSDEGYLVERHLAPTPRIGWGGLLASRGIATAMLDISDGLLLDARRLARGSGVGIRIDLGAIPFSAAARKMGAGTRREVTAEAVSGGEDYELLFAAGGEAGDIIDQLVKNGEITAACIGEIVDCKDVNSKDIALHDGGVDVADFAHEGWIHHGKG